jgi:beta-glucanase (GH16 family)
MQLYRNGYKLKFEENFDGGLDKNRWVAKTERVPAHSAKKHDLEPTHVIMYSADKHEGCEMNYLPENVYVDNGELVIKGDRYGEGFMGGKVTMEGILFARGYIEIEAKLPEFQNGVWPVASIASTEGVLYKTLYEFMAIHGTKGKTACNMYLSYIDEITETERKLNLMYGAPHRFYPDQDNDEILSPGYHTFGVEWCENFVIFYCDGVEYNRVDVEPSPYKIFGAKQLAKVNIGMSIGLPNLDAPDETANFPTELRIRSVKIYQCEGDMLIKRR